MLARPAALTVFGAGMLGILTDVVAGPRGQRRWRAHDVLAALVDEQPAVPVTVAARNS